MHAHTHILNKQKTPTNNIKDKESKIKTGKGYKKAIHRREYVNGQWIGEKMLKFQKGVFLFIKLTKFKRLMLSSAGEDVRRLGTLM